MAVLTFYYYNRKKKTTKKHPKPKEEPCKPREEPKEEIPPPLDGNYDVSQLKTAGEAYRQAINFTNSRMYQNVDQASIHWPVGTFVLYKGD